MPIRIYADTSVYGGVFDSGIDEASREFFEQVKSGRFELVTSSVVADELALAPDHVRGQFEMFLPRADLVPVEAKSIALQHAYLKAGIVGEK